MADCRVTRYTSRLVDLVQVLSYSSTNLIVLGHCLSVFHFIWNKLSAYYQTRTKQNNISFTYNFKLGLPTFKQNYVYRTWYIYLVVSLTPIVYPLVLRLDTGVIMGIPPQMNTRSGCRTDAYIKTIE